MYEMAFFLGYPLTFIFYMSFSYFWPPDGLRIEENLPGFTTDSNAIESIYGIAAEIIRKDSSIMTKKLRDESDNA